MDPPGERNGAAEAHEFTAVPHGLPHLRYPGSWSPPPHVPGSARLPAPLRFPSPQAAATPPPSSGPHPFTLGAPIRTQGMCLPPCRRLARPPTMYSRPGAIPLRMESRTPLPRSLAQATRLFLVPTVEGGRALPGMQQASCIRFPTASECIWTPPTRFLLPFARLECKAAGSNSSICPALSIFPALCMCFQRHPFLPPKFVNDLCFCT